MSKVDYTDDPQHKAREQMVQRQLIARGISNSTLLNAFRTVPRHLFIPEDLRERAYDDCPLPLGDESTISQPYIVALMIERLNVSASDRVLEIGTGSGYAVAILAQLCQWVYSVDIDAERVMQADRVLASLEITNYSIKVADGFQGWAEQAPFQRILVSAAPAEVPRELVSQLSKDGRMIVPLGVEDQELILIEKDKLGLHTEEVGAVRFVRMKKGLQ